MNPRYYISTGTSATSEGDLPIYMSVIDEKGIKGMMACANPFYFKVDTEALDTLLQGLQNNNSMLQCSPSEYTDLLGRWEMAMRKKALEVKILEERKAISGAKNRPVQGDPVPGLPADAPEAGQWYVHWKKSCVVLVLGCGFHTETMEALVTYAYDGHIWSRPLYQWDEEVSPGVKRFTRTER